MGRLWNVPTWARLHIYASASHTTPPGHGLVFPLWTCGGCGWVGFPPPPCGPVVVVDGSFGYVTYDL